MSFCYEVFEAGTELPGNESYCKYWNNSISENITLISNTMNKDNNNAIEIYNSSDTTIDLNLFEIGIYENGSMTPTTRIPLEGVELHRKNILIVDAVNEDLKQSWFNNNPTYVGK